MKALAGLKIPKICRLNESPSEKEGKLTDRVCEECGHGKPQ